MKTAASNIMPTLLMASSSSPGRNKSNSSVTVITKNDHQKRLSATSGPSHPNSAFRFGLFIALLLVLANISGVESKQKQPLSKVQSTKPDVEQNGKSPMFGSEAVAAVQDLKQSSTMFFLQWPPSAFTILTSAIVIAATFAYFAMANRKDSNDECDQDKTKEGEDLNKTAEPIATSTPSRSLYSTAMALRSPSNSTELLSGLAGSQINLHADDDLGCFTASSPGLSIGNGGASKSGGSSGVKRRPATICNDDSVLADESIVQHTAPLASSTPIALSPARWKLSMAPLHHTSTLHQLAKTATAEELSLVSIDSETIINSYDAHKKTPLHVAVEWNNLAAVEFLYRYGALSQITNSDGLDALHLACKFKRTEIVGFLIRHHVQLKRVMTTKWTPLHFAALSNASQVVEMLLKAGANPNDCDIWLETPLHKAAAEGSVEAARSLVKAGASLTARNNKEETPSVVAMSRAYDKLAAMLLPRC